VTIAGELYHVGIVVPDVESAMAHFTDLVGVEWGPVVATDAFDVRTADGRDLTLPNKLCYSTAPPYLELVEELPGSVWVCNEHSNLHHIGYWTDGLPADSGAFAATQCPLEICGRDHAQVPVNFAYHRDPLGVRFELVDATMKPMMEEFMFRAPLA
jgi:glyoxalase/bleomycin resistance protein/dioxygenase superfamily protein